MHLSGDLKLPNEFYRGDIGINTSINDEFTYLTSNSAPGVEDLFSLARFKGNLFGIKDSLNHQQLSNVWGDQGVVILFILFLTPFLFYSLDFLYLSKRECSSIGTVHLEVPINMKFKALFSL